jgi:hypothetical protein
MKNLIVIVCLLLASASFAQKKDKGKGTSPELDSLKAVNLSLSKLNDSLTTSLNKYNTMYAVIRDQVVKADFNPEDMAKIIESLRANRDSLISAANLSGVSSHDSLRVVKAIADSLRIEVTGLKYTVNLLKGGTGTNPASVDEFTGTWNIIARKIRVTGDAPRSGLIDISSDVVPKTATFLESNMLTSISFIDKEFAELRFSNGETAKCYYVINGFSSTKPYYIDFKGTKADIRMYFMNTSAGTRVSFQIPDVQGEYYFGQITR